MPKSIVELIIGDLEEKRVYRRFVKRVNTLPKDYRFAFKKIQQYMYNTDITGCDKKMFTDLAELFEASAAQGKPVLDVVGGNVAVFCDELIRASSAGTVTSREKLNQEILKRFQKEGKLS